MAIPGIDSNIIGDVPDLHAKRVVSEMLKFLSDLASSFNPALQRAISSPIGGSIKAQRRYIERVRSVSVHSPAIIGFSTYLGKRCRFGMMVSIWYADQNDGATVWQYFATASGPETETRRVGPLWRITNHALIRLVQRSSAHDAQKLINAMRAIGGVVSDAMYKGNIQAGDGKVLYVRFTNGICVLEWPKDSEVALVKTILGPDMDHPQPGALH
jgi:hypothetical protein